MIETVPSGTVLHGRYRIERVLGSGGFGHVYLAIDLGTSQQYAIKEYLVTGTTGQEQLKHEATVLSQLHHPNLPAYLDAFIERGRYYVVLNYIEGSDLTDLIRMARQRNDIVPIRRIMEWILAICDAVMFLHSQHPSVIHRDIKPDNIRIMSNGTAVLVDLGNAKAAADGARTLFFIRHQGTPGYAPPEQYPGGSGTDARSDIYALAATLYFALTAHEPPSVSLRNQAIQQGQPDLQPLQQWLANNPPEESADANNARQFRLGVTKPQKPAPRHSRHLAQLGTLQQEVLAHLNQIIQKAMAMRPKDRYRYVADFASDLRRVISALPPPPPSHPVDPHSTQPDLPGIYDAIQAAKDNAAQGNSGNNAQSAAPAANCPRCGAELLPKAVFCTRCGTALNDPKNRSAGSRGVSDISAEQTLLISQGQLQQVSAAYAQKHRGSGVSSAPPASPLPPAHATPTGATGPSGQPGQQNPQAIATQVPPSPMPQSQVMSSIPASPSPGTGNASPILSAFKREPKVILFLIVLLVLLLAIILMIVLVQHAHATALNAFWYVMKAKVASDGRNFSIVLIPSVSRASSGIWPRRPGVVTAAGVARRVVGERTGYSARDQRHWHA